MLSTTLPYNDGSTCTWIHKRKLTFHRLLTGFLRLLLKQLIYPSANQTKHVFIQHWNDFIILHNSQLCYVLLTRCKTRVIIRKQVLKHIIKHRKLMVQKSIYALVQRYQVWEVNSRMYLWGTTEGFLRWKTSQHKHNNK